LRRLGLTHREAAGAVGVSPAVVVKWCKLVALLEAPPKPKHPRAVPPQLRERARQLRTSGQTLQAIADTLGVSKTAVLHWCRDLPVPPRLLKPSTKPKTPKKLPARGPVVDALNQAPAPLPEPEPALPTVRWCLPCDLPPELRERYARRRELDAEDPPPPGTSRLISYHYRNGNGPEQLAVVERPDDGPAAVAQLEELLERLGPQWRSVPATRKGKAPSRIGRWKRKPKTGADPTWAARNAV